jgi:predicted RNA-binding Zn ribbon-like protein
MNASYPGPLRDEPLAVELHNTLYVVRGALVDGLETTGGLSAWLAAIGHRLPAAGRAADATRRAEFIALRDAVGELLHSALEGRRPPAAALEAVNAVAARAPVSPLAVLDSDGRLRALQRNHTADATDVALATFAADAIDLVTDHAREELRACGAPGCRLLFQKDHPRRTWCSSACGNRARQARHYERARRGRG